VFLSFCYMVLRWVLQLATLRLRSNDGKELEIVVLRHELAILRSECLDWLLNDEHLDRVLDVFVAHYNGHRPHRALALTPPRPTRPLTVPAWGEARVQRRDRLGGVVHEYVLAA
jgi:hypothetical protein